MSQLNSGGAFNVGTMLSTAGAAALTAGLTNGITFSNGAAGWSWTASKDSLAALAGVQTLGNTLVPQAGAATGSLPTTITALAAESVLQATVQTTLQGGSFLTNLRDSAATNAAASIAYTIGNLNQDGTLTGAAYVAAHAALGCASGAATGRGCGGGAIGGAVSATLSPSIVSALGGAGNLDAGGVATLATIAAIAGGGLAGLAGQNPIAGASAAQNEALNNSQWHDVPADDTGGKHGLTVDTPKVTKNILPTSTTEAAGPQPGAEPETVTTGSSPLASVASGGKMSLSDAQAYASGRAAQLQSQLPPGSQGRVTMGVGVVLDSNGNQVVVVSTSEPNGYLRPGVSLNPGEVVIKGTGHAEADITSWAAQNGYTVQTVGAGRPICANCAIAINGANAVPATPLKVPPK